MFNYTLETKATIIDLGIACVSTYKLIAIVKNNSNTIYLAYEDHGVMLPCGNQTIRDKVYLDLMSVWMKEGEQ